MTYVPFSTSDLYNWKLQNPSFSEKPQALISLLETLFVTHLPAWDDCQQLLQVLFTTEERDKIRREARKLVMGPNGQPTEDPAGFKEVFPSSHPENWDPNAPHGDLVWVKRHELKTLEPLWKGPHAVILTTPTAVKVDGVRTWIHHSQVKKKKNCVKAGTPQTDTEPDNEQQWKVRRHSEDPLKAMLSCSAHPSCTLLSSTPHQVSATSNLPPGAPPAPLGSSQPHHCQTRIHFSNSHHSYWV
ncbi:uncharacterized protein LOC124522801 isoform X1 [Lynx rufus]|uniref:uncharacterized protein LOC124522801 isoform X1 n=1 Tax=Lynx rufus TaxID=61384 RepID=UPI001F128249|nr:uncharacterized protein LOC124522801 isoform X1 [Lynx rufus]